MSLLPVGVDESGNLRKYPPGLDAEPDIVLPVAPVLGASVNRVHGNLKKIIA